MSYIRYTIVYAVNIILSQNAVILSVNTIISASTDITFHGILIYEIEFIFSILFSDILELTDTTLKLTDTQKLIEALRQTC